MNLYLKLFPFGTRKLYFQIEYENSDLLVSFFLAHEYIYNDKAYIRLISVYISFKHYL